MARTKNAFNKPKFLSARLSDLNRIFGPDTMIKISIDYKALLQENDAEIEEMQRERSEKTQWKENEIDLETSDNTVLHLPRIEMKRVKF